MEDLVVNLVTIIGLFLTVGAPIIKLNSTIVKVTARIERVEEIQIENKTTINKIQDKSRESHKKLHDRIDSVQKDVDELEDRVTLLEKN